MFVSLIMCQRISSSGYLSAVSLSIVILLYYIREKREEKSDEEEITEIRERERERELERLEYNVLLADLGVGNVL